MDESGVVYKFNGHTGKVTRDDRSEGYGVIPEEIRHKIAAKSNESDAMSFLRRANRDFRTASQ